MIATFRESADWQRALACIPVSLIVWARIAAAAAAACSVHVLDIMTSCRVSHGAALEHYSDSDTESTISFGAEADRQLDVPIASFNNVMGRIVRFSWALNQNLCHRPRVHYTLGILTSPRILLLSSRVGELTALQVHRPTHVCAGATGDVILMHARKSR